MEKSNKKKMVAMSDHQPAVSGATVVAAATPEGVNSPDYIEVPNSGKSHPAKPHAAQWKLLYKIPEAAPVLGVSPATIRRLIARGELVANRKLRHVLIPRSELERFANGGAR